VIKKGDVVLDLGANIGYWTCLLAELVGDKGHVYAFEPEPNNFQLLKKNVEINNYKNVTLEQKAVSNKTGKTRLFISNVTTDHRIYDWSGHQDSIEIDVVRLDDYFKGKEITINYIKSNLQGADFAAVQGMLSLIRRVKDLKMIVEYHPNTMLEFGSNPKEFIEFLINEGFKLHDVGSNEIKSIEPNRIFKEYSPKKNLGTSFLCMK
jgi:FkbM family methyltransferase